MTLKRKRGLVQVGVCPRCGRSIGIRRTLKGHVLRPHYPHMPLGLTRLGADQCGGSSAFPDPRYPLTWKQR